MTKRKPEPETPPWFEAAQDIYFGNPDAGAMPVAAFRKGDRVPPEMVDAHNLGGMVVVPEQFGGGDGPDGPDVPEGVSPPEAVVEVPPPAEDLPDDVPDAAGKE